MLVTEFAKKYGFKGKDIKIAIKVYGDIELSEDQWYAKLKGEYSFNKEQYIKNKKIRDVKAQRTAKKTTKGSKKENKSEN
jgi:hypothetical protein